MKKTSIITSLCALALATACGGEPLSGEQTQGEQANAFDAVEPAGQGETAEAVSGASDGSDVVPGEPQTLHQFEVQGATYTYLASGEDVMLHVQTSRTTPRLSIETSSGEVPTLLEIFGALQPDAIAHPRLVASHETAARALGRTDTTVLDAFISPIVEKTAQDLEDCRAYFLGVWGGGFGGLGFWDYKLEGTAVGDQVTASSLQTVANKFMAAGACNFAATQTRQIKFDRRQVINGVLGSWTTQLTSNIAVDGVDYIVHNPTATSTNLRSRMTQAANLGMQLFAARQK